MTNEQSPLPAELLEALWKLRRQYGVDRFWRAVDALPRRACVLDAPWPGLPPYAGRGRRQKTIEESDLNMIAFGIAAHGMSKTEAARDVLRRSGAPEAGLDNRVKGLVRAFSKSKTVSADSRVARYRELLQHFDYLTRLGRPHRAADRAD